MGSPMSSEMAIRARQVSKAYQLSLPRPNGRRWLGKRSKETFKALTDVSFDLPAGQVLGVVGRNGAGKSTLLKILSRTTSPTAGHIELRGRVGSLLEVGTGFHPELNGRENIYLNGTILGMTKAAIRRSFDDIVDFAEVHRFIDTPVKHYSSGMYMRLAFAIAAHLEPEILIVDEVLAVGDAAFQAKCLGKMQEVSGRGRTIVFVSHNTAAIEALCDLALYLQSGRVEMIGSTPQVIEAYLSDMCTPVGEATGGVFEIPPGNRPCALLRRLVIGDRRGCPTAVVRIGEPMTFRLSVEGMGAHPAPYFGLRLRSAAGQLVAGMNTSMKPGADRADPDSAEVLFHLNRLPLAPGSYWVDLGVGTRRGDERLDYVERAGWFEVLPGRFYDSTYPVSAGEGLVFLDFDWEARPVAESAT